MSSIGIQGRNLFYGAFAIAAAAVAGIYVGSNGPGREVAEERQELAEVRTAIEELNASIRELSMRLAERAEAPTEPDVQAARRDPGAEATGTAGMSVERLDRILSRLEATLAALPTAGSNPESGELRIPDVQVPSEVFETLMSASDSERKLRHFGWTPQKVLDTYGVPADMAPSPSGGGVKWYYDGVVFWFIEGRVASVFLH
jgi:hypothetical protein